MNNDLERKCVTCDGAGVVRSRDWQDWWRRHYRGDWRLALSGSDVPDEPELVECSHCSGAGSKPTEPGMELLAFLGRHLAAFQSKNKEG
jgi:hypothetical protein